jgi:hypothetical protein
MRNGIVASLLVVALLAGAGSGYLIGVNGAPITSTKSSSATTQTSCTISGETIGVALRVVEMDYSSHSLVPVADAAISGGYVFYCLAFRQVTPLTPTTTNSSGQVDVFQGGAGIYYLNVTDPQTNYVFHLSVPTRPVTATYVTLDIASGNVTTRFCAYNYNCSFGASTESTTGVACVQTASGPLFLIVKDNSGAPIPYQPLAIQAHLLEGFTYDSTTGKCNAMRSTHVWMNETGPDGKIELGMTGDVFNITTSYLGKTYRVNADAEGAESAECVTLSLPSGAVNVTFTGTFTYQC